MGTWGPGDVDSDDAVDYVSEVVRGFVGSRAMVRAGASEPG